MNKWIFGKCGPKSSQLNSAEKKYILGLVHTYRLIQMTMCKIHIDILSTHSVLLDILTVINTHYTRYIHIIGCCISAVCACSLTVFKCSAWHTVKWECAVGCISFDCSLA